MATEGIRAQMGVSKGSLDVDFTLAGLMNGIFATAKFMDAERRGSFSRSAAKIKASRANGAKGGRSRKVCPLRNETQ